MDQVIHHSRDKKVLRLVPKYNRKLSYSVWNSLSKSHPLVFSLTRARQLNQSQYSMVVQLTTPTPWLTLLFNTASTATFLFKSIWMHSQGCQVKGKKLFLLLFAYRSWNIIIFLQMDLRHQQSSSVWHNSRLQTHCCLFICCQSILKFSLWDYEAIMNLNGIAQWLWGHW